MRYLTATATGLAAAALPIAALAQEGRPYYHDHMWGGGWSGMFFGPLFMLLLVAAVVVAVVLVLRWLGGPSGPHPLQGGGGKTPLDILKERYARGEIDSEEFEERRRTLGD